MSASVYIDRLINWCAKWDGYSEKKNNNLSYLYTINQNVGDANYNCFAYDMDTKYKGFFNGSKNGYAWCTSFVADAFCENFGKAKTQKMLGIPESSMAAVVPYWRNYMAAINRVYSTPAVGDCIFFGDKHIGLVAKVNANGTFYTWEGNTTAGNQLANSGGQVHYKGPYTVCSTHKFGRPLWNLVDSSYVDPITTLKKGDKNTSVGELQRMLNKLGFSVGTVDMDYGTKTYTQVLAFQKKYGLSADGIAGPITLNKLMSLTCSGQTSTTSSTTITTTTTTTTTKTTTQTITSTTVLKKGMVSPYVKELKENLAKLHFYDSTINETFCANCDTALKEFQKAHNLEVDGEYGPASKASMKICLDTLNKGKYGVDLSAYQKGIDVAKLKKEGVEFAIIRAGYTSTTNGSMNKDTAFEDLYIKAKSNGLKVGVYYYSMAKTVKQAEDEAKFLYENCLKGKQFELPIYLDVEHKDQLAVGKANINSVIKAWVGVMNEYNYVPGVYSSTNVFNTYMDAVSYGCEYWIAQWSTGCTSSLKYGMWQFGGETNPVCNKKLCGMICDQDIMVKDYSYIISQRKNGYGETGPKDKKVYSSVEMPKLTKGMEKNVYVAMMQEALNYYGANLEVDGDFGQKSFDAVSEYQSKKGLTKDGIWGQQCWNSLKG